MRIRDAKKQASRNRVVEAARVLFEQVGFQETTVRMIAERAGLSPGGVFTTFDDKVAILAHILTEDRERLFDEMNRLAPTLTGTVRQRMQQLFEFSLRDEWPRLRMVVAYIGASYGWSQKLEDADSRLHRQARQLLSDLVREGVKAGEIRADVDADLLVDMIAAIYLRNFRTALYAGHDCEDLNQRVRRQLDLMFEGAGPR